MFTSLKGITCQVANLEQAKQWYGKILNQAPTLDSPFFVIFLVGDSVFTLVPKTNQSSGNDEHVIMYWGVADIDAAYQRLLELGATPHAEIRTVVNWRIATVTDPFGNILGIMGTAADTQKRSVENQPSETAMTVAFCRAFAATDEREELRGPDYLAEIFLTEDGKRPLRDRASREWVRQKLFTPGMYEYFFARTAYLDHIFAQALRANLPQIVFLGAGYDTRSYRFHELIKETRIFELDIEPTQKRKRELLLQASIPIPKQLTFVPINFKTDTLQDMLVQAGFDPQQRTLFIWEGVIYYLPAEAVDDTLNFIRSNSPVGSTLCFDYMTEFMQSINVGEPFRFFIAKGTIESFLSTRGLKLLEHLSAEDMERKYLTLRDGSSAGKVQSFFGLAHAAVEG